MVFQNMRLQEAVENRELSTTAAVKSIRSQLSTCKLTRFKSMDSNAKFYSTFFMTTLGDFDVQPTVSDWGTIYTTLLSDDKFCDDLAMFLVAYQPAVTAGMFAPLQNMIFSEMSNMKKNRVRFLSMQKALLSMIQMRFQGIANTIKVQVMDNNVIKVLTVIDQTLTRMIFEINTMTQEELARALSDEDIIQTVDSQRRLEAIPIAEDVRDVLDDLEHAQSWIDEQVLIESANRFSIDEFRHYCDDPMSEGALSDAAERAKAMNVARKKVERNFDEYVMKKVRKLREERRNRKHAEMVGEALRINHEIKRILASGAIGILNPTAGVIAWICSIIYDRKTDKTDRQVLVNQLRDELEIVDEKIQMAERQGDERGRIELIRFRQKLSHEYERIMKTRYDAETRSRLGISANAR